MNSVLNVVFIREMFMQLWKDLYKRIYTFLKRNLLTLLFVHNKRSTATSIACCEISVLSRSLVQLSYSVLLAYKACTRIAIINKEILLVRYTRVNTGKRTTRRTMPDNGHLGPTFFDRTRLVLHHYPS